MKVLVVAAQIEELRGIFGKDLKELDSFSYVKEEIEDDLVIYGKISGIGKVAMAFQLGLFLADHEVDLVINIGVAGSISKKLKPYEILVASKTAYHDVDVTSFGYKIGQMCSHPLYFTGYQKGLDVIKSYKDSSIKIGLILSGDSFMTKDNITDHLYKDYDNPLAVDMESASVAQCCYDLDIPCLIIRAISDDAVNEENKETYENRLEEASIRSGELAFKLINDLK